MNLTLQAVVFLLGVITLTGVAAVTDARSRRIPNWLTVPAALLGLTYQGVFQGWNGIGDGLLAFSIGFGALLVMWLIGGGGGGDVKLMGALSTWLGVKITLYVLVFSTLFVVLGTVGAIVYSVSLTGVRRWKAKYLATGKANKQPETLEERRQRRIMAYAVPVALATWWVMYLDAVAIRGGQLLP